MTSNAGSVHGLQAGEPSLPIRPEVKNDMRNDFSRGLGLLMTLALVVAACSSEATDDDRRAGRHRSDRYDERRGRR